MMMMMTMVRIKDLTRCSKTWSMSRYSCSDAAFLPFRETVPMTFMVGANAISTECLWSEEWSVDSTALADVDCGERGGQCCQMGFSDLFSCKLFKTDLSYPSLFHIFQLRSARWRRRRRPWGACLMWPPPSPCTAARRTTSTRTTSFRRSWWTRRCESDCEQGFFKMDIS